MTSKTGGSVSKHGTFTSFGRFVSFRAWEKERVARRMSHSHSRRHRDQKVQELACPLHSLPLTPLFLPSTDSNGKHKRERRGMEDGRMPHTWSGQAGDRTTRRDGGRQRGGRGYRLGSSILRQRPFLPHPAQVDTSSEGEGRGRERRESSNERKTRFLGLTIRYGLKFIVSICQKRLE